MPWNMCEARLSTSFHLLWLPLCALVAAHGSCISHPARCKQQRPGKLRKAGENSYVSSVTSWR